MKPLVSVIISTFHSAKFIEETLDSVVSQSYRPLELIITDDCSKDETVAVCKTWANRNSEFLNSIKIVESDRNTGVSANANRGVKASSGEWIKFLGGDDTLKPDCITQNMRWISQYPYVRVLFSVLEIYMDNFERENLIESAPGVPYPEQGILGKHRNAGSQYKMLLKNDRIHFSPTVFIHKETFISVGCFDERFKMLEDYPLWLNLTKNGVKLHFMDKITVNYRRHSNAINNTGKNYMVNPNFFTSEEFRRIYVYPNLPIDLRFNARFNWLVLQVFRINQVNHNNTTTRLLFTFLSKIINPFNYYIWLRKRLDNKLLSNELYV